LSIARGAVPLELESLNCQVRNPSVQSEPFGTGVSLAPSI
jgi:hypothetical protein